MRVMMVAYKQAIYTREGMQKHDNGMGTLDRGY